MSQKPVLMQLHWQNRDDLNQTEFVAQSGPFADADAFYAWTQDVLARRRAECPEGWVPLACTEDSEHFVRAAIKEQST